jgi:hypothetical protein
LSDITTRSSVKTSHRLRIILANPGTDGVSAVTAECTSKPLHNQSICQTWSSTGGSSDASGGLSIKFDRSISQKPTHQISPSLPISFHVGHQEEQRREREEKGEREKEEEKRGRKKEERRREQERRKKRREEGGEEGGAHQLLESVAGELLHLHRATTSPKLEETAPSFIFFNLKLWSKPQADLLTRARPSQAATHRGHPKHGEHIPQVPNHLPKHPWPYP